MPDQQEADYFYRMQGGDEKAFEYFFKKYTDALYAYALGFLKEKTAAEDVVQDVFVSFWKNRERMTFGGSVYGYLQRLVKNLCVNIRIHEEVERKYREEILHTEEEGEDWRDAEELQRMRQRLFDALDKLPGRCREIFMLSCVEGMKYKEIAKSLGLSENTIKTQVRLGYQKLREEIAASDDYTLLIFLLLGVIEQIV